MPYPKYKVVLRMLWLAKVLAYDMVDQNPCPTKSLSESNLLHRVGWVEEKEWTLHYSQLQEWRFPFFLFKMVVLSIIHSISQVCRDLKRLNLRGVTTRLLIKKKTTPELRTESFFKKKKKTLTAALQIQTMILKAKILLGHCLQNPLVFCTNLTTLFLSVDRHYT